MKTHSTPRLLTLLLFASVFSLAPAAELLTNGSFETNQGEGSLPFGWTNQSTSTLTTVRVTSTLAQTGSWSTRVAGRSVETDGLRLNITSALSAAGSGKSRWCRAYVRVDDFASVRVLLRVTDANGLLPDIILAEQIVRSPNQWIAVEGGSTITWSGTLVSASVRIEVQQLSRAGTKPAAELPDFSIDGLTMDDDIDGDGILDREEASAGFNVARVDTDGDGLPDRWELDHGFSPLANEAAADTDGDGFTNRQEFWAATDPRDANSYPGKPANPKANAATRDVLRWFALLPSQAAGRHLAVGQNLSDLGTSAEYDSMIGGLATATGKYPAILQMAIEPVFDRLGIPLQIDQAETRALAHWQAGGIPMLKWAIYNPWVVKNGNDQSQVDIPGLLNPATSAAAVQAQNQAAHDRLQDWMLQVGDALERLQQQGVVVMFRPMSEMNGGWFWWGHRSYGEYAALWDFLYDYFTNTRSLNNLIWVYESAQTEHAPLFSGAGSSASDYYYPGDDRVDAMCHNLYDADWVLPWDANRIHARYPKIYGVPQAGPDKATRTGTFDNLTYLVRTEAAFPRSSFIVVWNSFTGADPVTGASVDLKVGIVDNVNASALMNHPSIVTRDTVQFSVTPPPSAPSPVTLAPGITTQPASLSVGAGGSATFTVAADGSPTNYQWYINGTVLIGANSASLSLPSVQAAQAGDYTVVVTNGGGATTSNTATLTVAGAVITSQVVTAGHEVAFTAPTGAGNYQWQVSSNGGTNWSNLADGGGYVGTTTSTLALTGVTSGLDGQLYRYQATTGGSTVTGPVLALSVASSLIPFPVALAIDATGNLYVSDSSLHVVQRINPTGQVSLLAGTSGSTGTTDGSAALFNQPSGLAVAADGTVSVADTANGTIRRINNTGIVSTVAGSTTLRGNADGAATTATFNSPTGLAYGATGAIVIADAMNHTIRRLAVTTVSTLAGQAGSAGTADGAGSSAHFSIPSGVAVDGEGNVFVADTNNDTIRRISAAGVVTTLAGLAGVSGYQDGIGSGALFSAPAGVAMDSAGNILVADTNNSVIRKITPAGVVTLLAGLPGVAGLKDGNGTEAWFNRPRSLVVDAAGDVLVADTGNAIIRRISSDGTVTTLKLSQGAVTPVTPVTTPPPAAPVPTPPAPATPSTPKSGGGGGGAPSGWFMASLAIMSLIRLLRRRG